MKVFILIKTDLNNYYEILSVQGSSEAAIKDAEAEMGEANWHSCEEEHPFLAQWINYDKEWTLTIHDEEVKES